MRNSIFTSKHRREQRFCRRDCTKSFLQFLINLDHTLLFFCLFVSMDIEIRQLYVRRTSNIHKIYIIHTTKHILVMEVVAGNQSRHEKYKQVHIRLPVVLLEKIKAGGWQITEFVELAVRFALSHDFFRDREKFYETIFYTKNSAEKGDYSNINNNGGPAGLRTPDLPLIRRAL